MNDPKQVGQGEMKITLVGRDATGRKIQETIDISWRHPVIRTKKQFKSFVRLEEPLPSLRRKRNK